jgi:hypothetical protein
VQNPQLGALRGGETTEPKASRDFYFILFLLKFCGSSISISKNWSASQVVNINIKIQKNWSASQDINILSNNLSYT